MGQTAMQLDGGGKYWLLGLNRPDGVAGRRVGSCLCQVYAYTALLDERTFKLCEGT